MCIRDRLCSSVGKFVRREIDEIVRYSRDQKNFGCLSNCRYCTDRAQSLPCRASPQYLAHTNPDFIQIGSLSADLLAERVKAFLLPHRVFS